VIEENASIPKGSDETIAKVKALISALRAEIRDESAAATGALSDQIEARKKILAAANAENEKAIEKLSLRMDKLAETAEMQTVQIVELNSFSKITRDTQEKNIRAIEDHEIRLNGRPSDGGKEPSIETVRQLVDNIKATLEGTRGGVAFGAIADKFREVTTLVNFAKVLGGGTVITLIGIVLNVNQAKGPSTEVLMLQADVKALSAASTEHAKTIQDLRVKLAESRGASKP
jgi:hypothetical protein